MKFKTGANSLKGLLIHIGIVAGLFILLSFTFFYKVLPFTTNKNNIVTVPDLQGMTLPEVIKFLETKDLGYEVSDSAYNSALPPLTVLEQFPKSSAKVKVNRKINLRLNAKNPPAVSYPDLTGTTFDFAQKQFRTLDLKTGTIQYRADIAHNTILESRINGKRIQAGERIPKGTKIDLIIGNHTDKFPIPDFTEMPFDEAEACISGMDLRMIEHSVTDNNKPLNTIQKQKPAAGDTVRLGDSVELWVYNLTKKE